MMKIVPMIAVFFFAVQSTFAQIQRKVVDTNNIGRRQQNIESNENAPVSSNKDQLKLIRELNLSREQKRKLKEIRRLNETKKATVMNDESLSEAQKQVQISAIKRSGMEGLQGILNETQKSKMKELRNERKNAKGSAIIEE